MLKTATETLLNDSDTNAFGQYFISHYAKNATAWAYCHRLQCGINTNMHLERMHKTIKYLYLNGKIVKRLDKSITILMNFIKDKLVDRLIILNKGKLCSKLQILRKRHKVILTESYSVIQNERGWEVLSSDCSEIYLVEQKVNDCTCQLTCTECNACIHKYTCTCVDASIKWNMCKHIHSVCQYRKNKNCDDHNDSVGDLCIDHDDDKVTEQDIISSELEKNLPSTSKTLTLMEKVHNMSEKFLFIVRSIKNDAEYNAVNRLLDAVQPTLDAVRAHNVSFSEIQTAGPSNKNITPQSTTKKKKIDVPQRHLFSVKKGEGRKKKTHTKNCVNPQRKNSKSLPYTY
ncbi:uncharacterized protein LOC118184442 [Stegodyphus dumicola]|uniref:uncharacterized protein LOC118184442 n=1 Tax=Stegodyphus dumicola TaxID=202533 RepID=UPI0015B17344|nr:uncharacterized protein LOC118184442 [Stegodyphus dumicola]